MTTATTTHAPATRAATACGCPVPGCTNAATYDLAPNPGAPTGPAPPPHPDPPGVTLPRPPDAIAPGPWHLVTCTDAGGIPLHRTLWADGRLADLPPPPAKSADKHAHAQAEAARK